MTYNFLIYFLLMFLIGGIVITGWYCITRGEWVTEPNETKYWSGMIFSGWLRFWTQEKGTERLWYQGEQLRKLMMQIEPLTGLNKKYHFAEGERCISLDKAAKDQYINVRHYAEVPLKIGSRIKADDKDGFKFYIFFYKDDVVYRFPLWLRKPLATCIYCHSSVYGSIVWWIAAVVFKYLLLFPFQWKIFFIFWVPYMLGLSFVLPFLNKKV